jgi:hypothetical protein
MTFQYNSSGELLAQLRSLRARASANDQPNDRDDPQGAFGEFELQEALEALAEQKRQNKRKDEDHKYKLKLAGWLFGLLLVYLFVVLYIVMGNGVDHVIHLPLFGLYPAVLKNLNNDPNVLMTLLGTTSANIIGLYLVVVKSLFPESKAKKD